MALFERGKGSGNAWEWKKGGRNPKMLPRCRVRKEAFLREVASEERVWVPELEGGG